MDRFTLTPGNWYAAEILGEEFDVDHGYGDGVRTHTPIRIDEVIPQKTNKRILDIDFYHANYPEGVRQKRYKLETIERYKGFYLGRSTEHKPHRLLLLYPKSGKWLRQHFNADLPDDDVVTWLERNA